MNFKISVKTWIKHARKNVKKMEKQKRIDKEKGDDDTMSEDNEDVIEHTTFAVEIEVEELKSETDEEDEYEEDMNMLVISAKKVSSVANSGLVSPTSGNQS